MRARTFGMVSTILSRDYTWHALSTFFAGTPFRQEDRFILVDNDKGSLDAERLAREYPQVTLVSNETPQSFSKNMNVAMRDAQERQADAYLLNNDLIFAPGWLDGMVIDQAWLLAPVSNMQFNYRYKDLELKFSMDLPDYLGREATFLEVAAEHKKKQNGYRVIHNVPFYCVKIPYAVHAVVGLLDETYGEACWEDVDYVLRSWEHGFPVFMSLNSFVLHFYGKSTWRAEIPPELAHRTPSKSREGEFLFRKRWGEEIFEIFGFQTPEGAAYLKNIEQLALANCYAQIVKAKKPR